MPSNWASFLQNANRGYGQGFARYQQYQRAKDDRLNRQDMQAYVDAQRKATADQEFTEETVPHTQWEAIDRTGAVGGAPSRAIPTSALEAAEGRWRESAIGNTGAQALQNNEIPMRSAQGQPRPYVEKAASAPVMPPNKALDRGMPDNVIDNYTTATGIYDAPPKLKAKGGIPGYATADSNPKTKKASSTAAVTEVLEGIVPRATKRAVASTATELVSTGGTRQEHWDAMKEKLSQIYIRNGDMEGLMGLDSKISAMQQAKLTEHLTEAARLSSMGDARAAAESLYQAYSYYPDGIDVDLKVGADGQLMGYGYDEVTGEFKGGQAIDTAAIISLLEHVKDPIAFEKSRTAARMASEEKEYERKKDDRAYRLEVANFKLDKALAASKIGVDEAERLKLYDEMLGAGSSHGWGSTPDVALKNRSAYMKDAAEYLVDLQDGKSLATGEGGTWVVRNDGYMLGKLANQMAMHVNPQHYGGAAPNYQTLVNDAVKLREYVYHNSQVKGRDITEDEAAELMGGTNVKLSYNKGDPTIMANVNGTPYTFAVETAPELAQLVLRRKAASAAEADGGGAVPPPTALGPLEAPTPPKMGIVSTAIANSLGRSGVGTTVMEANNMFRQRGHLTSQLIEAITQLSPDQRKGLDPKIIAALGQ